MKVYLITEAQMQSLHTQLELTYMKDNNIAHLDGETLDKFQASSLYRSFNYTIRKWQAEMER